MLKLTRFHRLLTVPTGRRRLSWTDNHQRRNNGTNIDVDRTYADRHTDSLRSGPNLSPLPPEQRYVAQLSACTQHDLWHLGGAPVLGPAASGGYFTISGSISLNNADGSKLYLNINETAATSYKPLAFGKTATTTDWGLEGDTIITTNPRQLNFLNCATSNTNIWSLYLQEGNDQPTGQTCSMTSLHLPCLC